MSGLSIRRDSPDSEALGGLLREHFEHMRAITPPGSVHAFDPDAIGGSDIAFWTAWQGDTLVGCGALRELDGSRGEIKAMRTVEAWRGRGVGAAVLRHLCKEAGRRGYRELLLETGALPEFGATRAFYRRHGFVERGPFGEYADDPNSAFMTRSIG